MSSFDPRDSFPEFYDNPHITRMGVSPRWTVSTTKSAEGRRSKFPLDMRCLLDGGTSQSGEPLAPGTIRGAWSTDEECLVDLEELTTRFPRASNAAFYLRTSADSYVVLDIEAKCPPEEAARLLSVPGALYAETSMSGNGYHLLMPVPANFWDYPAATSKRVLSHPQGWWEILLEHWVTFTRHPVPADRLDKLGGPPAQPPTWEQLWAELAANAQESLATDIEVSAQMPEIPWAENLITWITAEPHGREPADFHHDMSRFEFAVLSVYLHRLDQMLESIPFPPGTDTSAFDDSARTWLIYLAASRTLPPRAKHSEPRGGMPFLLYRATAMVAERNGQILQSTEKRRARRRNPS